MRRALTRLPEKRHQSLGEHSSTDDVGLEGALKQLPGVHLVEIEKHPRIVDEDVEPAKVYLDSFHGGFNRRPRCQVQPYVGGRVPRAPERRGEFSSSSISARTNDDMVIVLGSKRSRNAFSNALVGAGDKSNGFVGSWETC